LTIYIQIGQKPKSDITTFQKDNSPQPEAIVRL